MGHKTCLFLQLCQMGHLLHHTASMHNKETGNSLSMEIYLDVLQACVMLPTPSWPMMSAHYLSAEEK